MKTRRRFHQVGEIVGRTVGAIIVGSMVAFVATPRAAPAAHAQVVPVSIAQEALPDSKTLQLPSRIEPRKPLRGWHKRLFFVMSTGVYAAAGLDMQDTASFRHHFDEQDPRAKPLVGLPTPACFAAGTSFATGVNSLGWKMARSPRWHKMWWGAAKDFDCRKCSRILVHPRA
jgi:hypothetical protein